VTLVRRRARQYPFAVVEPVVHLRAAVSLLGRFPALAGVNLDVSVGEIVHLQGPNGAGKSTLLRACAGLVRVVEGEAVVLGHDLRRERRQVRREVGIVGADTFLYDDLTVEENIRFWTRAVRADGHQAEAAMVRLGLAERLRTVPAGKLSTGQRRRTSLAAMLVRRPRLWLLDEPHAGLDQQGRDVVDALIRDASAAGATVLVASHELERAGGLGGRTVTIAGGIVTRDTAGGPTGAEGPAGDEVRADVA
jgi:heme ABC exporter ATP-binding subunit CcmA